MIEAEGSLGRLRLWPAYRDMTQADVRRLIPLSDHNCSKLTSRTGKAHAMLKFRSFPPTGSIADL